ncbi:hypothetical protein DMN91_012383 [Ooceraea biroi]|uniref:Uncharacterized protein n=1 Tax=Ooceraea biroi TaxID=2015173 RepID=A0A3L8D562_OOCBI|nr:uncharacterized protein LOC105285362 [Ooceraea biroi]RLU15389.1 hypothetical protein DMN91_012383 [Ooceraea biroi]
MRYGYLNFKSLNALVSRTQKVNIILDSALHLEGMYKIFAKTEYKIGIARKDIFKVSLFFVGNLETRINSEKSALSDSTIPLRVFNVYYRGNRRTSKNWNKEDEKKNDIIKEDNDVSFLTKR